MCNDHVSKKTLATVAETPLILPRFSAKVSGAGRSADPQSCRSSLFNLGPAHEFWPRAGLCRARRRRWSASLRRWQWFEWRWRSPFQGLLRRGGSRGARRRCCRCSDARLTRTRVTGGRGVGGRRPPMYVPDCGSSAARWRWPRCCARLALADCAPIAAPAPRPLAVVHAAGANSLVPAAGASSRSFQVSASIQPRRPLAVAHAAGASPLPVRNAARRRLITASPPALAVVPAAGASSRSYQVSASVQPWRPCVCFILYLCVCLFVDRYLILTSLLTFLLRNSYLCLQYKNNKE